MANENLSYPNFLTTSEIELHYNEILSSLLRGKHIQEDENIFGVIRKYKIAFSELFKRLHKRILKEDTTRHNNNYFYLDFLDSSSHFRGSSMELASPLTERQTIFCIALLDMFYERFFEKSKEIWWDDIRKEIEHGEFSNLYKKIFQIESRIYDDKQLNIIKADYREVLRKFDSLGWVKIIPESGDNIHFVIRESIHRFANLYKDELSNFEKFAEKIHLRKNPPI